MSDGMSDFLPFPMRVASKINQSSWAILSHDYSKWRRASKIVSELKKKTSPDGSCDQAEVPRDRDRLSVSGDQIRSDRRIISSGVSLAIH